MMENGDGLAVASKTRLLTVEEFQFLASVPEEALPSTAVGKDQ